MYQGKHFAKRKTRLPLIGAAALLLIVVLSLCFGGVFGDGAAEETSPLPGAETAADYLQGSYVQIDDEGSVYTDREVFVLRLAESINGEAVTALQENCLRGSSRISAVIVPLCITEIGDNAFADCENLEAVIFEGRADLSDMLLGEDCFGDAALLFELTPEADASEPASETEAPAAETEAPSEETETTAAEETGTP